MSEKQKESWRVKLRAATSEFAMADKTAAPWEWKKEYQRAAKMDACSVD